MVQGIKKDIDGQILHILGKIRDEYEIVKRQGFPSHTEYQHSNLPRNQDAIIPESRWWTWANELHIDYVQLDAILKIIETEGLLYDFQFASEYR